MEEYILEKRYEEAMKVINETSLPLFVEDTFEDIFLAYKQDEKVIKEMASYLVKDCEQIEKLECEEIVKRLEKTPYNCIDCIISCFRKKCE